MVCETCPYVISKYHCGDIKECYCDKLGDKIVYLGSCEKEDVMRRVNNQRPRKWNRYERKMRYKNKLKRLAYVTSFGWPSSAYMVDTNRDWTDDEDDMLFIRREYRANHAPGYSGYLKKLASRRFRRYKGDLPNGCGYKKTFDYWWELY